MLLPGLKWRSSKLGFLPLPGAHRFLMFPCLLIFFMGHVQATVSRKGLLMAWPQPATSFLLKYCKYIHTIDPKHMNKQANFSWVPETNPSSSSESKPLFFKWVCVNLGGRNYIIMGCPFAFPLNQAETNTLHLKKG